jgi:hypothetical protein
MNIQEAAKEYADGQYEPTDRGILYRETQDDFIAGAEWNAKQSPWISVEDRLPDNQDIVLVRGEYGGKCTAYLHGKNSGFITYGEDAYKVFGEITHWMPIPKFDE